VRVFETDVSGLEDDTPIGSFEKSVSNHLTSHNNQEDGRIKKRFYAFYFLHFFVGGGKTEN
jgi:hypothetical protein